MPDFVNTGGDVDVYASADGPRSADSLRVKAGQTITVPGEIVDAEAVVQAALAKEPDADDKRREQIRAQSTVTDPDDAFLVRNGDSLSLWPKSRWQLKEQPKPSKQSASKAVEQSAAPAAEGTN